MKHAVVSRPATPPVCLPPLVATAMAVEQLAKSNAGRPPIGAAALTSQASSSQGAYHPAPSRNILLLLLVLRLRLLLLAMALGAQSLPGRVLRVGLLGVVGAVLLHFCGARAGGGGWSWWWEPRHQAGSAEGGLRVGGKHLQTLQTPTHTQPRPPGPTASPPSVSSAESSCCSMAARSMLAPMNTISCGTARQCKVRR